MAKIQIFSLFLRIFRLILSFIVIFVAISLLKIEEKPKFLWNVTNLNFLLLTQGFMVLFVESNIIWVGTIRILQRLFYSWYVLILQNIYKSPIYKKAVSNSDIYLSNEILNKDLNRELYLMKVFTG